MADRLSEDIMEMREEIAIMLRGIDRYNPHNLQVLEEYVVSQVQHNHYDLEANLAVLKLYQFNPNFFQEQITVKILLKALTNLPNADFVLCKCLIDPGFLDTELIKLITHIHHLLETCQFKEFWTQVATHPEIFDKVNGFHDSIRKYICYVIKITFQRMEKDALKEMLGDLNEADLDQIMKQNGFRDIEDNFVFITNQEENIKTKSITEKVDFENVAFVLASYR